MSVDPILRMPELVKVTGLSKATIYRMIGDGDFPRPVQLGKQSVGWRTSAVQRWSDSLPEVSVEAASSPAPRETTRGRTETPARVVR